jgi:salicylate hydroxylase
MKKIAIIGCGISGLYFANKLLNKKNYDFTIYEKKSELDLKDGYGIQLSVNSIKLLNEIGFNNIAASEVFFPKKVNFFEAINLKKICEIDISKFNSENKKYTTLKRSFLIKFLLNNIPAEKIKNNLELTGIEHGEKIKLSFSNNLTEEFDYLVVSDGVFSKTKSIILAKETGPKFFNSVALRGNIKNLENNDISLYLGSNFHFVIYPVNQNKEFNFISIIRKKLSKNQTSDQNLFESNDFLKSLCNEIYQKTSMNLKDKIENIKSFPIYVSEKFENFSYKNIYFIGDALFTFPPSFAQGASQSIEAGNEVFEEINNNTSNYYKKRGLKIKEVNWRSKFNHFAFHLSNPLMILLRNLILKILVNNKNFLNNYLGKIYKG